MTEQGGRRPFHEAEEAILMGDRDERRPFHESIVVAIAEVINAHQLRCLGSLIKATIIPEGHDEIIEAWEKRLADFDYSPVEYGVSASILEQKQAAEAAEEPDGKKD